MIFRFFAHSGDASDRSDWQDLREHLECVARLGEEKAKPLGLTRAAAVAGLLHDLGKFDPRFQRYIAGAGASVDHSTAGAAILLREASPRDRAAAEALAYCILGHHAGLPDRRNGAPSSFAARIEGFRGPLDPAWREAVAIDLTGVAAELAAHAAKETAGFDLSVAVRMIFSCLVEADFLDTEAFYGRLEGRAPDRAWPALSGLLTDFRAAFDAHLATLGQAGDLNALRRDILAHVRGGAALAPGLFTLTVPTGGGKTLASLGFALDHAAAHGHRRIIYAIPFTSIIDQTAEIFRRILGPEQVLEHHSAIDEEKNRERQGRDKLALAMENWAAPVVVTTNVQLFESLFAARPSRVRKLHNIAGSVIVLDEAQTLPRKLLRPTLAMLDCLARHWGCSIVLCTATQPAVQEAVKSTMGALRELAPDPRGLAARLRRTRMVDAGAMEDEALIEALAQTGQGLMIVNSRAHALALFDAGKAAGLPGLLHLTTRQYAAHRQEILAEVRKRLDPRNPKPCRLIATSLVEAGVDLDFPLVWRARAGLDQAIQAAGRCNREGKRPREESVVTLFEPVGWPTPRDLAGLVGDAARMWGLHRDDPQSPDAVEAYFREVYFRLGEAGLDAHDILGKLQATRVGGLDFAFREIAETYRLIESAMAPVVIPLGGAEAHVERLGRPEVSSGTLARALQRHVVQVPPRARDLLIACGKAHFACPELRGDQFVVLDARDLYYADSGLRWEDAEYLGVEQWSI